MKNILDEKNRLDILEDEWKETTTRSMQNEAQREKKRNFKKKRNLMTSNTSSNCPIYVQVVFPKEIKEEMYL